MEDGLDGTSSGAIHGTPQQTADASTPVVGASPVARMQNLEVPEATPQVRHQNVFVDKFVSNEGANLQGKTTEKMELEEFEAFKSCRAIRKLQSERQL